MTCLKPLVRLCHAVLAVVLLSSAAAWAGDFKPIPPDELAMKDNPAAPGAHAMILEWTVETDDTASNEVEYFRIKIFTDQGKSHGDIEIPYMRGSFQIGDIKARTIQPDGTIVPFSGKVFEKTLVKGRGYQLSAKTFTFSDVRPGSILEYRYRRSWDAQTLLSTHWELQRKLFIRKATLTLKSYTGGYQSVSYISKLGPHTKEPVKKGGTYILTLENVPAFEEEEYTLPEAQLKNYIDFFYRSNTGDTPEEFWANHGKTRFRLTEDFIGKRGGIRQAVEALVAPTDTAEDKLRKLYARVQKIRNLSYESDKTAQEQSRFNPKTNNNIEDVLKNGYGYRSEINRLFVGMARAAGIEAGVLRVSQRDQQIFQKAKLDESQLDGEVAWVSFDGKQLLLDPSTPFCPFGRLAWENTGVDALKLDKNGGVFIRTPDPDSSEAMTRRTAELKMDEEGALAGTIRVQYEGHRALSHRLSALETDEVEQKKEYEESLEETLPSGSKVKLVKVDAATDGEKPLHLEFDVTIPSITSSVGSRTLLPALVFQSRIKNPFEFAKRTHGVYFSYPFQEIDLVSITLPSGMKVESLPKPAVLQRDFAYYDTKWEHSGNTIQVRRRRAIGGIYYPQSAYPILREFYSQVDNNDHENLVLRQGQ